MKAAANGVPSLSILDGWWIEGHAEGTTGWAIGHETQPESDSAGEVASLNEKLERVITPLFYGQPDEYARVMRSAIALNGSFFNAQRVLVQYTPTPTSWREIRIDSSAGLARGTRNSDWSASSSDLLVDLDESPSMGGRRTRPDLGNTVCERHLSPSPVDLSPVLRYRRVVPPRRANDSAAI